MGWVPFRARSQRSIRQATRLGVEELENRLVPSASVLTNHNDTSNDGQNLNETVLTPANVNSTDFGKQFAVSLDGSVVGQPLYVPNLNITTGPQQGVQNVTFVATNKDDIYAINADNGSLLWHTSLLHPFDAGDTMASVSAASGNGSPIQDTPVIDLATGAIYVESEGTENGPGTSNAVHYIHQLDALNLANGTFYANPTKIAEGVQSTGSSAPGYITGPDINGKAFDSYRVTARDLALDTGSAAVSAYGGAVVFMAYADPGDIQPYNGYIVGYSAVKDGSGNLDLKAVFNASPNGSENGIWQGGGAISIDASGDLYVETGNGTFETTQVTPGYVSDGRLTSETDNATVLGGLKVPQNGDYADSVIKIAPDSDTSQQSDNPNGFGLHVADYFAPDDEISISNSDQDLGSSSTVLLPDSVGSAAHQQLLIANDKQGFIYLLDRNNLGGYHGTAAGDGTGSNNVVQELDGATTGAWSTAAFYAGASSNSGTIYYATQGDVGKTFTITNATVTASGTNGSHNYSYPGSSPEISANGSTNGIVWTIDKSANVLIADNATGFNNQLYISPTSGGNALTGSIQTFNIPTVAGGHVFVATSNALNVYGLLQPPTDLIASSAGLGQVSVTWAAAAGAASYDIYRGTSSGGETLVQSGVTGTSFGDTGLTTGTTYYYQVIAVYAGGQSSRSSEASVYTSILFQSTLSGSASALPNPPYSVPFGAYTLVSGQAVSVNPQAHPGPPFVTNVAYVNSIPLLADASISADVSVNPATNQDSAGVILRGTSTSPIFNDGYYAGVQTVAGFGNIFAIGKLVGQQATPLNGFVAGLSSLTGTIELEVFGNTIAGYWNGQLMQEFTDNSYSAPGIAGFGAVGAGTTFTNVIISSIQAPALPFADSFSRSTSPSLGDPWSSGLLNGGFGIGAAGATSLGSGTNTATLLGVNLTTSTNVSAFVSNSGSGFGAGVLAAWNSATNSGYALLLSGTSLSLYTVNGGVGSLVTTVSVSPATTGLLDLVVSGETVSFSFNGGSTLFSTSAVFTTGTAGIVAGGTNATISSFTLSGS